MGEPLFLNKGTPQAFRPSGLPDQKDRWPSWTSRQGGDTLGSQDGTARFQATAKSIPLDPPGS